MSRALELARDGRGGRRGAGRRGHRARTARSSPRASTGRSVLHDPTAHAEIDRAARGRAGARHATV
ncbi:MAG: hypothetical protein MZW92_09810 [Comamonadaceae bacterium]|nr:hypothetical protein [Comamonadaceae bacterium]